MRSTPQIELISRKYREAFGASAWPAYTNWMGAGTGAALGYRRAGVAPLRTPPLHGRMDVGQALARLLAGSDYVARQVGPTAWRIERAPLVRSPRPTPPAQPPGGPEPVSDSVAQEPIVVTAAKRATPLDELPMAVTVVRLDAMQSSAPDSDTAMIAATRPSAMPRGTCARCISGRRIWRSIGLRVRWCGGSRGGSRKRVGRG